MCCSSPNLYRTGEITGAATVLPVRRAVRQQTLRTTVEGDAAARSTIETARSRDVRLGGGYFISKEMSKRSGSNLIAGVLLKFWTLTRADILKDGEKTNSQFTSSRKGRTMSLPTKVRRSSMRTTSRAFHSSDEQEDLSQGDARLSQVIGFTNDLGGAMGLEAAYNDELTGENGMVVTARATATSRSVLYQYSQYFDAENVRPARRSTTISITKVCRSLRRASALAKSAEASSWM
ncbi:MAG: hypothetical protein ACLRSD_05760 [Oscillibacter sp.]